ncbi:MAG: hypothetical protein ACLTTW_08090 [Coprobacter sp.]
MDLRRSWLGRISFGGQYALVGTSADAAIATEEELTKLKEENRWNYSSNGELKAGFSLWDNFDYYIDEGYLFLPADNEGLTFGEARLLQLFHKQTDETCTVNLQMENVQLELSNKIRKYILWL